MSGGPLLAWWGEALGAAYGAELRAVLTSEVGGRVHPTQGGWHEHGGDDYAVPTGTPVRSVLPGVVEVVFRAHPTAGNGARVRHEGTPYRTTYLHLSRVDVAPGQRVARAERLGLSGSTGRSTGPHLHLALEERAGAGWRAIPSAGKLDWRAAGVALYRRGSAGLVRIA